MEGQDNKTMKQNTLQMERTAKKVISLIQKMRKNAKEEWHPVWKNIPLAREMYDLLRDTLPNIGQQLDATDIILCCNAIFLEDLLDTREVPRLCLSFLQLRKSVLEMQTPVFDSVDTSFILETEEADRIQNELERYIDPSMSMEQWIKLAHGHLKFDPVERSPQWEEIIYDVEKECARRLKGEPRCMGFCFGYWAVKRAVLAQYGIEWHSPSIMNPGVMFD